MRLDARRFTTPALAMVLGFSMANAFQPPKRSTPLSMREFARPDLRISSDNVPLADALRALPNASDWEGFLGRQNREVKVFIDPRSGVASNVVGAFPLIPGDGVGNTLTLDDISRQLDREIPRVDEQLVGELVVRFVIENAAALGIDPAQLGPPHAGQATPTLWHVQIPQHQGGIPVRHGKVLATISHGNIVLLGGETWGNAHADLTPVIGPDQAVAQGLAYAGGPQPGDRFWRRPELEVVPYARVPVPDLASLGGGYGHRLVWVFGLNRPPEMTPWEVMVDAHTGEVLALEDQIHYLTKRISGGVYPLTDTEICPNPPQCGTMQADFPMPFANTGFPAPNDITNSAGLYDYTSGTVTTSLNGPYVRITDVCGAVSESSATGDLDLGGVNGQHDCTSAGTSAGNTASARSAFYELNKLKELGRGWLPSNSYLQAQIEARVNISNTCNANYDFTRINFYRSGGGCRNTGEIASVFDHEFGHALDDNDSGGNLSNSSEGYADIVGIYRLQASCVGHGFFQSSPQGCGRTVDGTGDNVNEDQTGGSHCAVDCSGVRDADYALHSDGIPDTPQNHVCTRCLSGSGPCGRQVHCSAAPVRQAAWDLVARDLTAPPFNYSSDTAFMIGNKLFYQGSGGVSNWFSCTCPSTSNGCGAGSGYLGWLAADDDNGNLNDGTPHMTAIFAAYDRHGIACSTITPTNSGCAGAPTASPVVTPTVGNNEITLTWGAVAGATKYWVLRTEGHAGCDFGKALIASPTGTTFTDTEVGNGRQYCYNVVAVGADDSCFGPTSTCVCASPAPGPGASILSQTVTDSCASGGSGDGNGILEPGENALLPVTITNDGSANLTTITGLLSTTTPGVTVIDNSASWPNLVIGASAASNPDHFTIAIDPSVVCSTTIDLTLALTYDQGTNNEFFSLDVGTFVTSSVASYDFQAGAGGFTTGALSGCSNNQWHLTTACGAPTQSAYFGVDGSCTYPDGTRQCGFWESPSHDLTGLTNASLIYDYNLQTEQFSGYDVARVQISTNGGSTWSTLADNQGTGGLVDGGGWLPDTIDITSFIGSDVRVRFTFDTVDTQFNGFLGFMVDNVGLTTLAPACTTCAATAIPGEPVPLTIGKSGPNLQLAWQSLPPSCNGVDFAVYQGTLSSLYDHAALLCTTGGSTSATVPVPADPDAYFLVTALTAGEEGSYGRDSLGSERPLAAAPCRGSSVVTACP